MSHLIYFLSTENELFCNLLTLPFGAIEIILFLYFTRILFRLSFSKTNYLKTIILSSIIFTIAKTVFPLPFNLIPNLITFIFFSTFYFKISLSKSAFSTSIFIGSMVLVEYIINFIVSKLLNFDLVNSSFIPLYKITFSLCVYLLIFLVISVFKHLYNGSYVIGTSNNKDNFKLVSIIFLTLLIVLPNYIFLTLLDMKLPTTYVIYNILSGFVFFLVGIYSTNRINKLQITTRELETANLYNSTLSKLVDSNRAFKHDINNIINSIGGYIQLNDMVGLKNYYNSGLLPEIKKFNNLSLLNPDVINSPPLFGLFLAKYNYADTLGVKIELNSFFDYSTINMNIFDFVKIWGILFDNAIEAASKCDDKLVNIHITIDFYNRKQVFKIKNTYFDKNLDINKIFEKDFSTKKVKSGFGLWEIKQILKDYPNVKLIPSIDDSVFTQKLEIFF